LPPITQSEPTLGIASLYVSVYTIGPGRIEVTDLTGYKVYSSTPFLYFSSFFNAFEFLYL